ncbi:MAG: AsmA family protein [Burkholderiales bacterium]|nr:AsmA family protein [Burkholderiales bacterium]
MPRTLNILLIAFGGIVAFLLAAFAFFAATFNPNDYKPLIIKLVQEKKQRTLAIPGDIKLSFFPRLGADLGNVSLSERNSGTVFVAVNRANVSLALLPLFSKQLVVDRVKIDGLRATIVRNADGSTNFDDLLSHDESSDGAVKFDIDGVAISNARLTFNDRQERRTVELSNMDLETDRIAGGVSSKFKLTTDAKADKPVVDAKIQWKSAFTIDLDKKHYILKDSNADIKGKLFDFADTTVKFGGDVDVQPADKRAALKDIKLEVSGRHKAQVIDVKLDAPRLAITDTQVTGGKLRAQLKLQEAGGTINADLSVPIFEGSPKTFKVPSMVLDAVIQRGALDAKANLAGTLNGDIDKLLFAAPQLKLTLSGKQGGMGIDLQATGSASADLKKHVISSAWKGKLDESAFDAKLGINKFSPAAYRFDIGIDRIDADRYRDKANNPKQDEQTETKPIDLSAWRDVQAEGELRIGALKFNNIKLTDLQAAIRSGGGKLTLDPLSAHLYGGSASGAVSATTTAAPRITLRQNLAGIQVGQLLQDAIGKHPIEGRGNISLDVAASGGGFVQIKKSLDGTARLELRDGAVYGVNVAQAIRNAKARIGQLRGGEAPQAGTSSTAEKTDFSEMSGSFRIRHGVAHNDDLIVKSPLLRVGGSGDIDLGNERLDYLARATVVSTLQGQGGPELQALKGLTVPVRLSGPFNAISWHIDFQGLVSEVAKQKLQEKKEEVRSQAQKSLDEQKDKVRDQLKDQLKGLFGK